MNRKQACSLGQLRGSTPAPRLVAKRPESDCIGRLVGRHRAQIRQNLIRGRVVAHRPRRQAHAFARARTCESAGWRRRLGAHVRAAAVFKNGRQPQPGVGRNRPRRQYPFRVSISTQCHGVRSILRLCETGRVGVLLRLHDIDRTHGGLPGRPRRFPSAAAFVSARRVSTTGGAGVFALMLAGCGGGARPPVRLRCLPRRGLLNNRFLERGGLAAHAAAESKPARRTMARCVRIRRPRAAQALQRANIRAATVAASRLRLTALAVR